MNPSRISTLKSSTLLHRVSTLVSTRGELSPQSVTLPQRCLDRLPRRPLSLPGERIFRHHAALLFRFDHFFSATRLISSVPILPQLQRVPEKQLRPLDPQLSS